MIWAGPGPISRFYDPVPVRRCKKYRFLTKMHKGVKRISVESSQSNVVSEESSRQEAMDGNGTAMERQWTAMDGNGTAMDGTGTAMDGNGAPLMTN